ncbi:MAG: polysaccharide biosynthesis tyrosine autokinase [Ferruginibacter sp.]|nr:polysaccharide biosynthesis tyrosine autokinase [Ferruginibacter sp.]
MEDMDNELLGESASKKTSPTIKDLARKYFSFWPLFIISMAVFVGGAFLYLRRATPKYAATALIMVKGEKKSYQSDDLIASALTASRSSNMENELQLMKSIGLMERVVIENQFNISYYIIGRIKTTDLYLEAPFRFIVQKVEDSSRGLTLIVKDLTTSGAVMQFGPEKARIVQKILWNTPYVIDGKQFVLAPRGKDIAGSGDYMTIWSPVSNTAANIAGSLSIDWLDKKTSIIKLGLITENVQRGKDILNALAKEYDRSDLEEKNIASRNTIRFIDDRLEIVSNELSGVEGHLENYQGQNQIINVESQSGEAFGNSNSVSKDILNLNIQKGVVQQIQGYFNNPESAGKLVPSSLGIQDPTLGSLIAKYNELAMERERKKPQLAANSLILKDLESQINDVRGSVLENLQNINKNLNLQQGSLEQKNSQYRSFLSSLPRKERVMQEIKRKQSITEGLYLYLLQKREESSISAGAENVSVYKQIDKASGYGPVEPNSTNVMIMAVLFGLLLPVGFIVIGEKINDKITGRDDVTSKLAVPVYGEIGHLPKKNAGGIVVLNRDLVGEQFRLIRTNLALIEKNRTKQVILITSSGINEGKSMVSLNLAAALAIPGKKVALLEFDMRKPGISKNLGYYDNLKGLSNYLSGETKELSEIYQVSEEVETLHIYPAGDIPDNPADLLLSENVTTLFDLLKRRYDYVVVDTPPVALVSDAFILNKFCDTSLFVIRQRHTPKKQLDYIQDIAENNRLNHLGLIINDLKTGAKYGNAYGSSQPYNYVYGQEAKKGLWRRFSPFSDRA